MTGRREDQERDEQEQPRVKVTDKRRVRADAEAASSDAPRSAVVEPGSGPILGVGEPPEDAGSQLETVQRQAAEYRGHLQRLQADFDNYRKRVLKEQTRAVEMASEPFVRRLLEVLDEFELALMAAERRPDFDQFLRGVELVYAKLLEVLRSEGVERIDAEGKPFDPELHEALMQTGEGDGEPFVADVLRQGYRMRSRVLRPAGVKVARK
jgi:molecular chaperone GrpE